MPDANDMDLVREYAARNSDPAFETLVRRHVGLVYSVALRQVGLQAKFMHHVEAAWIRHLIISESGVSRLRPTTA